MYGVIYSLVQFRNWVFLAFRNLPFSISFCLRSHFECNIIFFFVRSFLFCLTFSILAVLRQCICRSSPYGSFSFSFSLSFHFATGVSSTVSFCVHSLSLFFPIHLSLSRFVHQLGGRFIFSQIKCTNVVVEKLNWIRRSVFGYYHIQRLLGLQFCAQKPYEIAKRLQSKYAKQTDSDAGDCTHSLPFMRMICVFFLLLPQCRVLSKICFSRRVTKKA